MNGKAVADIRQKLGMSKTDFSAGVGVTLRTIKNWEDSEGGDIPIPAAHVIRTNYQEPILAPVLEKWTDEAFRLVPSELVCLWLVERNRCILFPSGNRLAVYTEDKTFDMKERSVLSLPTMSVTFAENGLTTIPIKKGRILRLTGDEIQTHPDKRYKGSRSSNLLRDGECESLLHCPIYFEGSGRWPEPVILLGFQNKLVDGKVVNSKNNPEIFTYEDFGKVDDQLIQKGEMEKEIYGNMKLLDMVGEPDC